MAGGVRWTPEQWEEHRRAKALGKSPASAPAEHATKKAPKVRKMNKLEAAYQQRLDFLASEGAVRWYGYERITLKLGDDTRYTPDFVSYDIDGRVSLHEVKGPKQWEDGIVKLRVAATMFPFFTFYIARKVKGEWEVVEIRRA